MERAGIEIDLNKRRILERHIHLEDEIGRRQDHFFFVGQDHRLYYVDHLGDVRHAHAVGMARKDVQVQRRQNRVSQAVLLDKKVLVRAGQRFIPSAPLIHHQRNFLLRVVPVHHTLLLVQELIHEERGLEGPGVIVNAEAG